MTRFARQYREIARSLSRLDLMAQPMDDAIGSNEDFLRGDRGTGRFLDFYGEDGLRMALERYGLFDAIRKRGWNDFTLRITSNSDRHTLVVEGRHPEVPGIGRLVELVVRRDVMIPAASEGEAPFQVLTVDWILLQDPARAFGPGRPALPGQRYPGLGIGERVVELLTRTAARLELDGWLTVAEHFHNAVMYARGLPFFVPEELGTLRAMERDLLGGERLTLAEASWAFDEGCVRENGEVRHWRGEAQVRAVTPRLERWFLRPEYRIRAEQASDRHRFTLDRARLDGVIEARCRGAEPERRTNSS